MSKPQIKRAKKSKKKSGNKLPPIQYKTISAMADLETYVAPAEVILERVIMRDGKPEGIKLVGRRLLPGEYQQIKVLLESAMPPQLPPEKPGGEPRYDFRDPAYVNAKNLYERRARAYALIKGYPLFSEAFAATKQPESIEAMQKFMDAVKLEDAILHDAYQEIMRNVVGVDWQRVNFI